MSEIPSVGAFAIVPSNNLPGPIHWQSPSVANGAVYCSDSNANLTAFWAGAASK